MTRTTRTRLAASAAALVLLLGAAGCGDDGDDTSAGESGTTVAESTTAPTEDETTTTAAEAGPLDILVTNDDGYAAEGIDAVVEALVAAGHEVTVVAPLEQQSGTGGTFTEGAVETEEGETASGHPAIAVNGFPSDTVRVAIDEMQMTPDLVVSGINEGQNTGALLDVSGTIGAARAAVARGVPALALSASTGDFPVGYALGAELAVEWVTENAAAIAAGEAPVEVASINIPSCTSGGPEELVEVPVSTEVDLEEPDCESELTDPADDVEGLANGFPVLSIVPAEAATPPQPG